MTKATSTKNTLELLLDFSLQNKIDSSLCSFSEKANSYGLSVTEVNDVVISSDRDTGESERKLVLKITGGSDDGVIYLSTTETKDSYANYSYYGTKVVKPAGTKVVEVFE